MTTEEKTIRNFIEKLVIPHYPQINSIGYLEIDWVGGVFMYSVGFIMNKEISSKLQQEIDKEMKTLFKMSGLDKPSEYGYKNDFIKTYFSFDGGNDYSFTSSLIDFT
jgi:hypothetical protein